MPAICERRILRVGGSQAVALPPDWLAAFALRLGDVVEVIYDSMVLVKPRELLIDQQLLSKELSILQAHNRVPSRTHVRVAAATRTIAMKEG